jgi:hypothetical protein
MGLYVAVALAGVIGLFAFLAVPVEPAAAFMAIGVGETWNNNGTITGVIVNDGTINNNGTINVDSTFHNRGTLNNYGTINIFGFSTLWNDHGTINNYGTIKNHDSIFNDGGIINNFGTITNICTDSPGGTLNGNPIVTEPCFFELDLFEASDSSDGVFDLGQEARAVAETNRAFVTEVTFKWIDPSGNVDSITTVPAPWNGTRQGEDTFTPDEVGMWIVEAHFNEDIVIAKALDVDFMVIPESPIGIIALMGSSLASLGGYAYLSQKRSRRGHTFQSFWRRDS